MPDKNAPGKRVSQEQSIINKLKSLVKSDSKIYWILWKYAPNILEKHGIKTFKELTDTYSVFTSGMTEDHCSNWQYEKNVQTAIKWLYERMNQQKMLELYDIFYQKAKEGDTASFKAFIDFSDRFFTSKGEDELLGIIQKANITDNDETDESFDFEKEN